ncbi:SusC/RagA family TonB-linked outer membrane protein [Bacteroides fluxus]|nr:TonB-dependent receptor [Bacteroides fluxus]
MKLRKTHVLWIPLLVCLFLVNGVNVMAAIEQAIHVKGQVVDTAGEPVIGANIVVKGTTTGVISDIDGNFAIDASRNSVLLVSFIGYKSQEVKVTGPSVKVVLADDAEMLNEVVVVGYGSQKKSDITGAMVNVKSEALQQAPVGNIGAALQGLAAGVDVQMAGGNTHPGAAPQIRVRGERSLNGGNDVLIVVDGIPFSGGLNEINNDDVESISVLKDASATAIYGSRGANGVLLITTKRGNKGKVNVSYSGYYGITTAIKEYDVMNSSEYIQLKKWATYNANPDAYTGIDDPNLMRVGDVFRDQEEMEGYLAGNDTDWQSMIFRNGMTTNHQVAINGGNERTTYSASVGYYKGQNNYEAHSFERMTAKLSLDTEITSFLKVGLSTLNTYIINKGQDTNPMEMALRASPFTTPYKEDGSLRTYLPGSGQNVWNPLLDTQENGVVDDRKSLSTFTTGYIDVKLPLGIKYRFNGGVNLKYYSIGQFQASNTTKRMGALDWSFGEYQHTVDYTLENILTWDYSFNDIHNFNVTGLFSAQEKEFTKNNVSGNDYYDDNIQYYNPGLAQGNVTGGGGYEKWGLLSYMGRLNYNYKEKYLLTATVRYDGSSRLADGNKWHAFPSVALGWNLMRENFMQKVNADVLSGMKLRFSWGNVGSTAISPYQTMSRLDTGSKYLLGTNGVMGVRPGSVPDKSLGWENTETWNVGIDFGFLNNRITGTIEWYQQNTTDLLLGVNLPSTSGYSQSYLTNRGATRNRGLEFNVTTVNIAGDGQDKLSWSTDLNIFGNRNKIMDLGEGVEYDKDAGFFLGQDRYVIYSYEHDGLWQDTPEDRALAESFGYATSGANSVIGTVKIKNHHVDYEEDGVTPKAKQIINEDDKVFIGQRAPKFEGGINNRFAWKGFDLSFLWTFRCGGTITSDMHNGWMNTLQGGYNNLNVDYWTPDNTTARWPKPTTATVSNKGLLARYDGSYLKLRNLTVGYNIPKTFLSKLNIQSARVYATGSNLYTWFSKEYREDGGIDPETTSTINLKTPPTRTFVFGLNLTF